MNTEETPATIDMLNQTVERLAERNAQLRRFALRLLDPEDLGYAATPEIRDSARSALGLARVETQR